MTLTKAVVAAAEERPGMGMVPHQVAKGGQEGEELFVELRSLLR